jgi:tetratricopeptide (TPR) repeat protein
MKRNARQPWLWVALGVVLFSLRPCWASNQAHAFFSALEAYKAGDYNAAAQQFEAIARTGVRNGRLFYNLGNAYLKDHRLGPAILWYERALKLMPDDPDLRFNLNYARSMTKDAPGEVGSPLVRIFFFWEYYLSDHAVIWLAIGFNVLFWVLLSLWVVQRRHILIRGAMAAGAAALIFVLTAGYDYYEAAHPSTAIVLPDQAAIRSGLEDSSTQLFVLHAGAKVSVLKQLRDYYQIRFSADKIGWVGKDKIGII